MRRYEKKNKKDSIVKTTFRKHIYRPTAVIIALLLAMPFFIHSLEYRPVDRTITDATSLALGGTGVSRGMESSFFAMNPASLAEIMGSEFHFGVDAMTRITRVNSDFRAEPEYIPAIAYSKALFPDAGAGIIVHSPFQRRFDDEFAAYSMEIGYARSISRNLAIGVSLGALAGLQAKRYDGWGVSMNAGLLFRNEDYSIGLSYRPPGKVEYPVFADSNPLSETYPGIALAGITFYQSWGIISIEADYMQNSSIRFVSNGTDMTPQAIKNNTGNFHPHIGAQFPIKKWPGLTFYTGLMSEDYYDYKGENDPQIIWTWGISGIAGRSFWQERLKITFGYASSFIPSAFAKDNHQIEKMVLTFYLYF